MELFLTGEKRHPNNTYILFFCAFCNSCCSSSVFIKCFWRVHAVLAMGKVKWQVVLCLLVIVWNKPVQTAQVGITEGAHNLRYLANKCLPCSENAKRLFSGISGWCCPKALLLRNSLLKLCLKWSFIEPFVPTLETEAFGLERILLFSYGVL